MKIELFSYDTRFFFTRLHLRWLPPPRKRSPPRRIWNKQFKKTLPAVPLKRPWGGLHQIYYDFHGSGVNHIDSCLFLQSKKIEVNLHENWVCQKWSGLRQTYFRWRASHFIFWFRSWGMVVKTGIIHLAFFVSIFTWFWPLEQWAVIGLLIFDNWQVVLPCKSIHGCESKQAIRQLVYWQSIDNHD